jgi:hypothetical protein
VLQIPVLTSATLFRLVRETQKGAPEVFQARRFGWVLQARRFGWVLQVR